MEIIHSEIDIEATARQVWEALTAFPDYGAWNPFIRAVRGEPRPGARLDVRLVPPGGSERRLKPTVLLVHPDAELRWLERGPVPGLLDRERRFIIETFRPDRVRFFHREIVRGMLAARVVRRRREELEAVFQRMNEALKRRAER